MRRSFTLKAWAGAGPDSAVRPRVSYDRLLRIQLDAPKREMRPSVRKLLAQGKIVIKNGKYVLP